MDRKSLLSAWTHIHSLGVEVPQWGFRYPWLEAIVKYRPPAKLLNLYENEKEKKNKLEKELWEGFIRQLQSWRNMNKKCAYSKSLVKEKLAEWMELLMKLEGSVAEVEKTLNSGNNGGTDISVGDAKSVSETGTETDPDTDDISMISKDEVSNRNNENYAESEYEADYSDVDAGEEWEQGGSGMISEAEKCPRKNAGPETLVTKNHYEQNIQSRWSNTHYRPKHNDGKLKHSTEEEKHRQGQKNHACPIVKEHEAQLEVSMSAQYPSKRLHEDQGVRQNGDNPYDQDHEKQQTGKVGQTNNQWPGIPMARDLTQTANETRKSKMSKNLRGAFEQSKRVEGNKNDRAESQVLMENGNTQVSGDRGDGGKTEHSKERSALHDFMTKVNAQQMRLDRLRATICYPRDLHFPLPGNAAWDPLSKHEFYINAFLTKQEGIKSLTPFLNRVKFALDEIYAIWAKDLLEQQDAATLAILDPSHFASYGDGLDILEQMIDELRIFSWLREFQMIHEHGTKEDFEKLLNDTEFIDSAVEEMLKTSRKFYEERCESRRKWCGIENVEEARKKFLTTGDYTLLSGNVKKPVPAQGAGGGVSFAYASVEDEVLQPSSKKQISLKNIGQKKENYSHGVEVQENAAQSKNTVTSLPNAVAQENFFPGSSQPIFTSTAPTEAPSRKSVSTMDSPESTQAATGGAKTVPCETFRNVPPENHDMLLPGILHKVKCSDGQLLIYFMADNTAAIREQGSKDWSSAKVNWEVAEIVEGHATIYLGMRRDKKEPNRDEIEDASMLADRLEGAQGVMQSINTNPSPIQTTCQTPQETLGTKTAFKTLQKAQPPSTTPIGGCNCAQCAIIHRLDSPQMYPQPAIPPAANHTIPVGVNPSTPSIRAANMSNQYSMSSIAAPAYVPHLRGPQPTSVPLIYLEPACVGPTVGSPYPSIAPIWLRKEEKACPDSLINCPVAADYQQSQRASFTASPKIAITHYTNESSFAYSDANQPRGIPAARSISHPYLAQGEPSNGVTNLCDYCITTEVDEAPTTRQLQGIFLPARVEQQQDLQHKYLSPHVSNSPTLFSSREPGEVLGFQEPQYEANASELRRGYESLKQTVEDLTSVKMGYPGIRDESDTRDFLTDYNFPRGVLREYTSASIRHEFKGTYWRLQARNTSQSGAAQFSQAVEAPVIPPINADDGGGNALFCQHCQRGYEAGYDRGYSEGWDEGHSEADWNFAFNLGYRQGRILAERGEDGNYFTEPPFPNLNQAAWEDGLNEGYFGMDSQPYPDTYLERGYDDLDENWAVGEQGSAEYEQYQELLPLRKEPGQSNWVEPAEQPSWVYSRACSRRTVEED